MPTVSENPMAFIESADKRLQEAVVKARKDPYSLFLTEDEGCGEDELSWVMYTSHYLDEVDEGCVYGVTPNQLNMYDSKSNLIAYIECGEVETKYYVSNLLLAEFLEHELEN